MDLGLLDRSVLIVGASAGVGAATARLLIAEGARVILVARRADALGALADELRSRGGQVFAIAGDASDPGFLDNVVAGAVGCFGALHALAVVAGPVGARASILDLRNEDWDLYHRHITLVTVGACRAAIPELLKHSGSAIVLTSAYSIRSQKSELIGYTAMKSTIVSIAKNLAKTYGGEGLRVNCIAPGVIEKDSEDSRELAERYGVPAKQARYEHVHRKFGMNVALQRAGRHEEFADLVAYLLSARASYITGATINIDGGTDF
jgi:NAD(P)-dependent dehydrogenase (short-subunit alcohol dehydrogenase family)